MIRKKLLGSHFLRDSTVLQVGGLCIAGGNFLGTVALTHVLGAQKQGEFYLASAVYALFWFALNLGLYPVTISKVAEATSRGDRAGAAAWMGYQAKAGLLLGALTAGLSWFLLPGLVDWWVGDGVRRPDLVARCAAVLAITPLVELPRVVALAGLEGTRRMLPVARVENAQEALRVFLVVVGALWTRSPLGPCVGMVVASGLGSLLALFAWHREARREGAAVPGLREVLPHVRDVPLTHGLALGLKMGVIRNIDALGVMILPPLILGRFSNTETVAYLRIAQRLVDVARQFMKGISRTALPALSQLAGVRDHDRLRRVYWKASLLSGLSITAGVLVTLPFLPGLLRLAFPPEFVEPVWISFLILLPGTLVVSFSVANDTFYLITHQLRVAIFFSVIGLGVNSAVLAVLCWRWPDYGAAAGLSFTFLWSLVHLAYAWSWFRSHRGGGAGSRPSGPGAGPVSVAG